MNKKPTQIEFEESSGNIFADLGLKDADALHTRGMIGYHIIRLLKDSDLKQREISDLLSVKQAEVSHLMNGHFSRFTTDKLFDFLKKLGQKITIQISPHNEGEPFQQVAYRVEY